MYTEVHSDNYFLPRGLQQQDNQTNNPHGKQKMNDANCSQAMLHNVSSLEGTEANLASIIALQKKPF